MTHFNTAPLMSTTLLVLLASISGCRLLMGSLDECAVDQDCASHGAALVCRERLCVTPGLSSVGDGGLVTDSSPPVDGAIPGDAARTDSGGCPGTAGPAQVDLGAFCIDSMEVSRKQYAEFVAAKGGDAGGQAASCAWNTTYLPESHWPVAPSEESYPASNIDWCDAYSYCAWAGKHLCGARSGGANLQSAHADATKSQWFAACSHDDDGAHDYAYGSSYDPAACNGIDHSSTWTNVGGMATCEGGYPGIFDMSGNVYEWEDSCDTSGGGDGANDTCLCRGGSFAAADPTWTKCSTLSPSSRSSTANTVGFRCCSL